MDNLNENCRTLLENARFIIDPRLFIFKVHCFRRNQKSNLKIVFGHIDFKIFVVDY